MCQFFSAISNGKGKVLFFTLADIVDVMASGNKDNLEFNSHTSIAFFNDIKGEKEDKWNKWEYDVKSKILTADSLNTADDSVKVKKAIEKYFKGKDVAYMQNLYNRNSGNGNSGNRNFGDGNSGNWNSGNWNSGNRNSGNGNSGNGNSGNWNSGYWNSGYGNSKTVVGGICSKDIFMLFNKICTKEEFSKGYEIISRIPFLLTEWIYSAQMTEEEKKQYPNHAVCDGYLKKYDYKEAWKNGIAKCSKETIGSIKTIKNFNPEVWEEITGTKI